MSAQTDPATSRGQGNARTLLALVLAALGLWTLRDFLPALVWAGIFAIALWPSYGRICKRMPPGRDNVLLPTLFTLGVALIFLLPFLLIALPLGRDAHGVLLWLDEARKQGIPPPALLANLPVIGHQANQWWSDNLANPSSASELLHRVGRGELFNTSRQFGSELLHRIVLFGFTLLTLFFLFRDGAHLTRQMRRASLRMFGPRGEKVGEQMVASVHGTVNGLVLVGLGEGLLLGVAYAIAGVTHAALFGLLTALAAMIPFGAPVIFGLAALVLVAQGAMISAILVFGFGILVTFVADHFIRPVLIGGATRLPFILVLLSILGGIGTWGLLGLFVGPALMAALVLIWREWSEG